MGRSSGKSLVLGLALVLLVAMAGGAKATTVCNIPTDKLASCLPAVTGDHPTPPTEQCCKAISKADMQCLCRYRSVLPNFGINPANAMALPEKCGLKAPPKCPNN
ncbi:putative lipid-transfer protein DIR1 [Syzygium oleosum]|uniref:putative lipid-transfer protein DIR1 n=1 Tax=Syzygium oleosum TaxID=219896 RepID=UPI0011D1E9FF|nr:putative lipid-transfer protein DIR1 [Syzygium oleosum]